MPAIDQLTPGKGLPLPHPDNGLEDDVLRLRQALTAIDSYIAAMEALLASNDPTLDTLQELVTSIKANKTTVDALLFDKADKTAFDALVASLGTAAYKNVGTAANTVAAGNHTHAPLIWRRVNASGVLSVAPDKVLTYTSAGAIDLTLDPALPDLSELWLKDAQGTHETNRCRIYPGTGRTIMGAAYLDLTINYREYHLALDGTDWRI